MSFDLRDGIVRILKPNGETAGAGFVLSTDGLIATCSHVVQSNEAQKRGELKPERITVVFRVTGELHEAQIEPNWWRSSHKGEDIAILRIIGRLPERVKSLPLGSSKGTSNHPFDTFGFPNRNPEGGIWGDGHILGETEIQHCLVRQLSSNQVTPGFSGAPVLDRLRHRVVGMVTSISRPDEYGRLVKTAFITPIETLRDVCSALQLSDDCPYRNLKAFTEYDVNFFSGRDRVVDELVSSLQRNAHFLALFGPSGSGKSSVVQAGLIPRLQKGVIPESDRWKIIVTRPTNSAFEQQITNLSQTVEHVAMIIDPFEEIFVSFSEETCEKIITQLVDILESSSRITLIIVMRNDFYNLFVHYETLAQWKQGRLVDIPPTLKRDEIVAMIEEPAKSVGWQFEDEGLIEQIVNDAFMTPLQESKGTGNSTILPLLEFALTQLWERREDGILTREAYKKIGGVAGSLKQWADDVYYNVNYIEKKQRPLVRRIFTGLVNIGDKDQHIPIPNNRRRRELTSLVRNEAEVQVVELLIDARLLVASQDTQNSKEMVEIIHDALLREWGLLKQWIEEDDLFLGWHQKLEKQVQKWKQIDVHNPTKHDMHKLLGRRDDRLLEGRDLTEAENWLSDRRIDLSKQEQEFIEKSRKQQRNTNNRIISILSAFLIVVTIFGSVAVLAFLQSEVQRQLAVAQVRIARSQGLATQAQNYMLKNQFDLALLLSVKAYQTDNNYETRDTLLTTLEYSSHIKTMLHNYTNFVFSPSNQTLLSSSSDETITFWDKATKKGHSVLIPIQKNCNDVRIDPDGKRVAAVCPYGVGLWEIKTGRQLVSLPLKQGTNSTILAFSPDGRLLATNTENKDIVVWNLDSGKPSGPSLHTYDPLDNTYPFTMPTAFSSDGKLLASSLCWALPAVAPCGEGMNEGYQQIFIWDIASGKRISTLISHQFGVMSLAFSPNDNLLATGGVNGTIDLWNIHTQQPFGSPLIGHTNWVESLAFSPDGLTLGSGSADKTVRLWDVAKQQNFGDPLLGHQASVSAVSFSPDGQQLVSGSRDNTLIIWNLTSSSSIRKEVVCNNRGISNIGDTIPYAFDPPGHLLVTHGYHRDKGNGFNLCDVTTGASIGFLQYEAEQEGSTYGIAFGIAFSPDGHLMAAFNAYGTITLWNVATQKPVKNFSFSADNPATSDPATSNPSVMFSPNGRLLALYGDGITFTLLDITTEKAHQLKNHGVIEAIAFSSDGEVMALGNPDKTITLVDVATGKSIGRPLSDRGGLHPVAFTPDGKTLIVSGSTNGTITLWDTTDQKRIKSLPIESSGDVKLSLDGKILAVVSGDNALTLWDMASQKSIAHPLLGPFSPDDIFSPYHIMRINFGYDGQLLTENMGAYGTEAIVLWNLSITSWIASACNIANRELTLAEWKQFVGDEPFSDVCPDHPL